jgi:RHS repeat-associated protein
MQFTFLKKSLLGKSRCLVLPQIALVFLISLAGARAHNVGDSLPPKEKPPCKECDEDSGDKSAGDPVLLHSGEFYWYKSFFKPAGDSVLGLTVRYSSYSDAEGALGSGWVHNFQYRLIKTEDGMYALRKPLRKTVYFEADGANEFRAKENSQDRLYVLAGGVMRLRTTEKEEFLFDADGKPTEISYPSKAKKLTLAYDPAGKLPVTGIPRASSLSAPVVTARDWRLTSVAEVSVGGTATGRRIDFVYDVSGHLERVQNESNTRSIQLSYKMPMGELKEIADEVGDAYEMTYYDGEADRGKPYWRYMKTFVGQGCSDCSLRTNYYKDSPFGEQQAKLIRQTQGANEEGEEINISYSGNSTTVSYKVKNTSTGEVLRTRGEIIGFTADAFGEFRVSNRTVSLPNSEAFQVQYTYNPANGRIATKTSPSGGMVTYAYDSKGNITKETHKVSATVNKIIDLAYDARNNPIKEEIYYSNLTGTKFTTERTFNGNDQMTMERRLLVGTTWVTTNYSYFASGVHQGLLQTKTDPRGNVAAYEYTTAADAPAPIGLLKREYDPARPSHQTLYTYDANGNRLTKTDALGRTTTWAYDAKNRMTREIRPDLGETVNTYVGGNLVERKTGNATAGWRTTRYQYNGVNQQTKVLRVNDLGQEVLQASYEFDSEGKVLKATNALNQSTVYEYNLMGWKTKVKQPYNGTLTSDTAFTYDKAGRIISEMDAVGTITDTVYDFLDQAISVTEAKGFPEQRTTEQSYDANGNVTEIRYKDAAGTLAATTRYYYDLLDRKTGINWNPANANPDSTGARELPQKMEYDGCGNLTASIDGRGNRTTYGYDSYDRQTNIQFADRLTYTAPRYNDVEVVYDEVGNVVQTTDGRGTIRHYHYDSMDRRTHESIPVTTALTGNWWNTPSNVLQSSIYNLWGQPLTTTSLAGGATGATYDAFGRVSSQTDAAELSLTYVYNALDQPLEIQYPALGGQAATKIRYAYHPNNGSLVNSVADRAGNVTSFSYDLLLRRERIRDSLNQPAGAEKVMVFDRLGRIKTQTDEVGNVTTTAYDIFNQALNVTLPDHTVSNPRIQTFTYNAYGQLLTQAGAGGYPVTYTYDLAGNRLTLVTQYGAGNTNQTTTWAYDSRNRLSRKTYADNTFYDYTYDQNGNLKTRKDAKNQTTIYSYNLFNQVATVDYPADSDVIFTYDASGRRLNMTDGSRSGAPSTEWTYDAAGRIATCKQHPVDRIVSYGYNAEGNRTSMSVEKMSAPGSPWTTAYTYDAAGRLDTLTDSRVGEIPFDYTWEPKANLVKEILMPSGAKQQKTYDALARLSEIKALNGSGATVNRYTYTYDAASQRKDVTLVDNGKITYGYDAKRQVASAVKDNEPNYNYGYTFDNIGNWLTGKTGQTNGAPVSKTFTPNNLNQYSQVSGVTLTHDANGSLTHDGTRTYSYDQENRLTAVAGVSFTYDGMSRRVASGTTKFLYDGVVPIAELDATNNYTRTVTRGLDLANTFQETGGIGGILATVSAGVKGYYFYDGNGNVADVLDDFHSVIAHYAYDPFGNKVAESGSYAAQPYQWSTKEFDSTSGLVYYLYRFYSPQIGRWLSRDPVEERGGVNLFALLSNDPVNGNDVNGLANYSEIAKEWFLSHAQGAGYDWAGPFPGTPIPLGFIPGCPFLQILWTASINVTQCCDRTKGERGLMYTASGGIEAYLQWGKHWKWSKHDTKFGPVESGRRHPNKGFRDRKGHLDVAAKLPDCPKERWEWKSWTLTVFLRGTAGTGIGTQINLSTSVSRGQDFSWKTLWDNANAQGSLAWGVAGLSVEIGGSGSVSGVGRIK